MSEASIKISPYNSSGGYISGSVFMNVKSLSDQGMHFDCSFSYYPPIIRFFQFLTSVLNIRCYSCLFLFCLVKTVCQQCQRWTFSLLENFWSFQSPKYRKLEQVECGTFAFQPGLVGIAEELGACVVAERTVDRLVLSNQILEAVPIKLSRIAASVNDLWLICAIEW